MKNIFMPTLVFELFLIVLGSLPAHAVVPPLFSLQPYEKTKLPTDSTTFAAQVLPDPKIKGQDVLSLKALHPSKRVQIVELTSARGAGLAPIALTIQLANGERFNLLGAGTPPQIVQNYEKEKSNPNRDNLFFQNGIMAPLFPMANRLTGKEDSDKNIQAVVQGVTVTMPLNNKGNTNAAREHQLHGLLFGQFAHAPTQGSVVTLNHDEGSLKGDFEVGKPFWSGNVHVAITETLKDGVYFFRLHAVNTGKTAVPVGAGAHPYFSSPDMGQDAIRIHIPASQVVEVNNLDDVLPTGKILALKDADPALDFSQTTGELLYAHALKNNPTPTQIDNLWVSPKKDEAGHAYAEVVFPKSRLRARLTGLTDNINGIQGYAPKFKEGQRPFVALELVTNLPDPREELWKKIPTGMKLLKPGQSFDYGYKIEVSEVAPVTPD